MSIYEITYISKDENDSVKKIIESAEGKIIFNKSLGRKKFVYPIKHETAGFYTTIVLELDGQKLSQLDKELRMNQEILRYLTISYQKEFSPVQIDKKLKEFKEPKQKGFEKTALPTETKLESKEKVLSQESKEIKLKKESPEKILEKKTEVGKEEIKKEKETPAIVEEGIKTPISVPEKPLLEKPKEAEKPLEIKKTLDTSGTRDEEVEQEKPIFIKPKVTIPQPKKEAVSEEERLAKLEEKLDELLKD